LKKWVGGEVSQVDVVRDVAVWNHDLGRLAGPVRHRIESSEGRHSRMWCLCGLISIFGNFAAGVIIGRRNYSSLL
jgi:hypothetical protein